MSIVNPQFNTIQAFLLRGDLPSVNITSRKKSKFIIFLTGKEVFFRGVVEIDNVRVGVFSHKEGNYNLAGFDRAVLITPEGEQVAMQPLQLISETVNGIVYLDPTGVKEYYREIY